MSRLRAAPRCRAAYTRAARRRWCAGFVEPTRARAGNTRTRRAPSSRLANGSRRRRPRVRDARASDERVIDTPRLALEPQCARHAAEMFVVLSDAAIYRFENAPPASLEWLRERFIELETRRSADGRDAWLNWVLRLRSGGPIGYVQATVDAQGQALIAYVLASTYWGRGLAHEAVQAMVAELGSAWHVHTLLAVFKRDNLRSRRLLERLGFEAGSPAQRALHEVEDDEDLMQRALAATVAPA